jgi:peptidoglycan hydrolase-like protein with peptidoglycan-binding domain
MKFNEFKIVEAPDLMTQYNQGGKKALPAIKDLQTKLQAAGFDPNGIDGKYGPGTFKAVQAYQKANGLQADGQAGDSTLAKINTASTAKPTATATPTATPTATATPKDKTAPTPKVSTGQAPDSTTPPASPANAAPTGGTQPTAPQTTPQTTPKDNTTPKDKTPPAPKVSTGQAPDATTTSTPTATDQTPTKAQDGGDASTYTLGGKPVTRAEYEKQFGTDVSGRQNDVANLKAKIQGSSRAAEDEKRKWEQAQLDDPNSKYYNGVPADPDDPSYPAELKAIDDKYAKQNVADQQKIKDLSSDPRVANNVKSDFDKALDGDDDAFGKSKIKDPFADDPEGDAEFDKALDGNDDDFYNSPNSNTNTTTSNNNTTSNSTSTSNVTTTGGTTTSVQQSGGGSTTRFASKYADNDKSNKLKAQAKDIERNQMKAFADQYQKDNPTAKRFDFIKAPGYKKLKKQAADLKKQSRDAKTLVHPSGEVDVNGKTSYYGKGANSDGSWDGQQFQPTKETKLYFDIMKEILV